MSSQIRKKLTTLELDPPIGSWQKIASALDNAGDGMQFPKRLKDHSVVPPQHTWEQINYQLDEMALEGRTGEKLYAAEIYPPPGAWHQITEVLDHSATKDNDRKKRLPAYWKYAAAIFLIGFLGYFSLRLFPGASPESSLTAGTALLPVSSLTGEDHNPTGLNTLLQEENRHALNENTEAREAAALEASKKSYASLDLSGERIRAVAASFRFDQLPGQTGINESDYISDNDVTDNRDLAQDRYIKLFTPDGHVIRMSKKLSNLVCCVAGEEADKNCESQLEKWRKQMACSDASHPGNFMDILSLVSSLQDQ